MIGFVNDAEARQFKKSDFFNFEYAVKIWGELKTGEQYDAELERVDRYFQAWKKRYEQNSSDALQELKTHPDAALIKQGHDLELTYYQWVNGYQNYARGGAKIPWNHAGYGEVYCPTMKIINIFTKSCTDYPDWRTKKGRAEDEASVAKRRAAYKAKMEYIMGRSFDY